MRDMDDVCMEAPSLVSLAASALAQQQPLERLSADESLSLPLPVSHAIFDTITHRCTRPMNREIKANRELLEHFVKSGRYPLSSMHLSGAEVDDTLFSNLLIAHHKTLLHLGVPNGVTNQCLLLMEAHGVTFPQLNSLSSATTNMVGGCTRHKRRKMGTAGLERRDVPVLGEDDLLGRDAEMHGLGMSTNGESDRIIVMEDEYNDELAPFTSRCPHVKHLSLAKDGRPPARRNNDDEQQSTDNAVELLARILEPIVSLETLDISHWSRMEDLRCLRPLIPTLTSLVLFDVPDLYKAVDTICEMKQLLKLDVSQSARETGMYPRPATCLYKIISSLTHLTHLDLTATNLVAQPSQADWPNKDGECMMQSDIYALRFLSRPLDFLGLFNCENASHFQCIPAIHVTGDASEQQVINALRAYNSRASILQAVLNESYQLYRFGNNNPLTRHTEALHLVLQAMSDHLTDSTLQIAGSASLFYIIRKVKMNRDTKRRVVGALLSGMETHIEEQVMVRNCCLSLCQFEIPHEILFDYSRLAILLVTVLQHHNSDSLTQRIVVFLLNSMACHVEGDQKIQVGSIGAIDVILEQIKRKLNSNTCDDVMEVGWSFLWNITDETPSNCQLFLHANGLKLFEECFAAFSAERELVRNMMGLIGNIAEVDTLRSQLMLDSYIKIFCTLLRNDDERDSIEISYNSAGVLAHLASDGEENWTSIKDTTREHVMDAIVKCTSSWKLDTKRFINYRSFRPILRLIPRYHAYGSQHWAVWALANLTTTDGCKYCAYVVDEGGEQLLNEFVVHDGVKEDTRRLANVVLTNIHTWRLRRDTPAETWQESMDVE